MADEQGEQGTPSGQEPAGSTGPYPTEPPMPPPPPPPPGFETAPPPPPVPPPPPGFGPMLNVPLPAAPLPAAKGRGRGPLIVTLAVLVVAALGGGAAVVLLDDDQKRDPGEALAAAQKTADDADSFRFTFSAEDSYSMGDSSTTTDKYDGEGEWGGDTWHIVSHDTFGETETVFADHVTYDRSVEDGDNLDDEMWARWEIPPLPRDEVLSMLEEFGADQDEDFADTNAVDTAVGLYLGGDGVTAFMGSSSFVGDPAGFVSTIQSMAHPTVEEESDDVLTLGATLKADDDYVEAYGSPLPDGKVELDVDAQDVPVALRLEVELDDAKVHFAVDFRDWNEPMEVDVPSDDEIDETPNIDEEAVREAAAEVAVVAPTSIPEDWELSLLESVEADLALDTSVDDSLEDCAVVEIDWDQYSGDEDDMGYLYLWMITPECAMKADDTPFAPGGPGGLPSRENSFYDLLEVQVGNTVVQVDTSLDGAELDAVLSSLQPIDVEALIDEAKATAAGYDS